MYHALAGAPVRVLQKRLFAVAPSGVNMRHDAKGRRPRPGSALVALRRLHMVRNSGQHTEDWAALEGLLMRKLRRRLWPSRRLRRPSTPPLTTQTPPPVPTTVVALRPSPVANDVSQSGDRRHASAVVPRLQRRVGASAAFRPVRLRCSIAAVIGTWAAVRQSREACRSARDTAAG